MRVIKSFAVSLALMLCCLTAAFAQNQRKVSGKFSTPPSNLLSESRFSLTERATEP